MGWDLSQGNLSTVGVVHPGLQFIYSYTYHQSSERNTTVQLTVFAVYTILMTISTRSRAAFRFN